MNISVINSNNHYDHLIHKVAEVLYLNDPMGTSCRYNEMMEDEYVSEASSIIFRLESANSAIDVTSIIYDELLESFGVFPNSYQRVNDFLPIANTVWKLWLDFNAAKSDAS